MSMRMQHLTTRYCGSLKFSLPHAVSGALIVALAINMPGVTARAEENSELLSMTVLVDSKLAIPMAELGSRFASKHMTSVSDVFGNPADEEKKILDGESADLLVTDSAPMIERLKRRGLVDVYSVGKFADQGATHYYIAIVAGENMTPARDYLHYLHSDETTQVLKENGLTLP